MSNDALPVLGPAKALKRQGSQLVPFLNSIACARRGQGLDCSLVIRTFARKQERTDSEVQPSEFKGLWRSDVIALLVECADTLIQNRCSILQHDLENPLSMRSHSFSMGISMIMEYFLHFAAITCPNHPISLHCLTSLGAKGVAVGCSIRSVCNRSLFYI